MIKLIDSTFDVMADILSLMVCALVLFACCMLDILWVIVVMLSSSTISWTLDAP